MHKIYINTNKYKSLNIKLTKILKINKIQPHTTELNKSDVFHLTEMKQNGQTDKLADGRKTDRQTEINNIYIYIYIVINKVWFHQANTPV